MDRAVDQLATGSPSIKLRQTIAAAIERTPQISTPTQQPTISYGRWKRLALSAASVAALTFLAYFVGRQERQSVSTPPVEIIREKVVEVVREKPATAGSPSDRALFTLLLKRNSKLVHATQAKDRLDALLDMADDCRQHALALIAHGPRDSLPITVELYGQLLREGVVAQVAREPVESRPQVMLDARARLAKMTFPADTTPQKLPQVVEDQRALLQAATRAAIASINDHESVPVATRKPVRLDLLPPAAALVSYAIAFSSETDPLARADACANCVQRLLPYLMLCLAEDTAPQRAEMGQQFGELINYGVYAPLELAAADNPPPITQEKVERINDSTSRAIAELEKNLQSAPPAAKPGLERALEASKKGWEKGKGKGKGPPWKRNPEDGDPKAPPGKGKGGQPRAIAPPQSPLHLAHTLAVVANRRQLLASPLPPIMIGCAPDHTHGDPALPLPHVILTKRRDIL